MVADYATRLTFLLQEDQEDSADDELDRVIGRVFDGASLDDVLDSNWDKYQAEDWSFEAAQAEALKMGYDLLAAPKTPVRDWEYFWFMALAGKRGWIARTPEQKAEVRLRNEADEFLADSKTIRPV